MGAPRFAEPLSWHARLALRYRRDGDRTVAADRHEGPLRVLKALYPEGAAVCHHVVVHPPGGVVGGDALHVDVDVGPGAHALLTTPGATRFYRCDGVRATQRVALSVAAGGRLEWLPLEAIAHPGCDAASEVRLTLADGAEAVGWDVLALGLPAAGAAFDAGVFRQHLEIPGVWLERGTLAATDRALLDGRVGLAGRRVVATMWWAQARPLTDDRREAMLEAARQCIANGPLARTAGASAVQPTVVVVRVLADGVEAAMALLRAVRAAWRAHAWALPPTPPRIWRT